MNVIGHQIVDGVPYINGKRATECDQKKCILCTNEHLSEALAPWLCPECEAHLSKGSLICTNLCHLSAASLRRFNEGLAQADARVKARKSQEESDG